MLVRKVKTLFNVLENRLYIAPLKKNICSLEDEIQLPICQAEEVLLSVGLINCHDQALPGKVISALDTRRS